MLYSSINNEKIKNLKKLNNKKYRDLSGLFLIEGEHLIKEALDCDVLEEVFILDGVSNPFSISVNYVTMEVMKYISSLDNPSSMIGVCRKIDSSLKGSRVVALDGVQDPGNLGTIIRSCVAFGVDTLVLSSDTVDLYNPKVIRATQGMIFKLNIVVSDLVSFVSDMKSKGFKIYSTKVNGGNSLKVIEKSDRFVIIMGNEGNGVSKEVSALCDSFIYIDMSPLCESLNVGVATSIILYEFGR